MEKETVEAAAGAAAVVEAAEPRRKSSDNTAKEPRKSSVAMKERRKTTIAQENSENLRSEAAARASVFDANMQKQEYKWRNALLRRTSRFDTEEERKHREEEELGQKRTAVEAQRKMTMALPQLSRQAALEEKRQKVEHLKQEKIKLKFQAKADELKRQEGKQTWFYIIRQIRNMQQICKEEKEIEKERELEEAKQKMRKLREEQQKAREEQKLEDKKWKRRISQEVKKGAAKLRKKRKEEEGEVKLFMSRFRALQIEIKKRKRREKMRKLREEEKRLQEKKKTYEKELARRAEVKARLDYMRKVQDFIDAKRSAEMEKMRKQYEAECAVYEAQRKKVIDVAEQIKKHAVKVRLQREKDAKEKLELEKSLKKKREIQRRTAVSSALAKNRKRARALVERRARQLAEEEVAWQLKNEQSEAYNKWAREQWAERVLKTKFHDLLQRQKDQERQREEQERKRQAELQRRDEVQRRIEHYAAMLSRRDNAMAGQAQRESGAEARRKVLSIEHREHQRKIETRQRERFEAAERSRQEAEEGRQRYIQDRENELQHFRALRKQAIKKATQKVWR